MNCASNTTIASESKCETLRMVEDANDERHCEKGRKIEQERMRMKEKENGTKEIERERKRERERASE